jgi:ATP-dependent exoDNAse (exonuclease V) alpha subunit
VAAAAYRTGTKIRDERADKIHDYSSRTKGVIQSVILRPEHAPDWTAHTESLWNRVESKEPRKDSQLAREVLLSLPKELSTNEQWELAVGWAQRELVSKKGMIAEVSLHHPKGGKENPHCHILCTMRTIEGDAFSAKKPREWNDKGLLLHWRESWCDAENAALERAGRPERVDHRSLKAQGIDREPEIKIGAAAMAMKRKGLIEDPERCKLVRQIKLMNEVRPMVRSMQAHGDIRQRGNGANWWERSIIFMSRVRDEARDKIKGAWQRFVESKREKDKGHEPER